MTRRNLRTSVVALTLLAILLPSLALAAEPELPTPLLLSVLDPPSPFTGSDQRIHLVYELWITNFSSGDASLQNIAIVGDGTVLHEFNAAEIAHRLQPAGQRESVSVLPKSTQALLFIHFQLSPGAAVPHQISHRIMAHFAAAPPGHQELTETGGTTSIDPRSILKIGPPLAGDNYIAADSCCDATRHTRAALPVNGQVWIAQRYAVDWEQLDKDNRIYSGPREKLESYTIFGKPAIDSRRDRGLRNRQPSRADAGQISHRLFSRGR